MKKLTGIITALRNAVSTVNALERVQSRFNTKHECTLWLNKEVLSTFKIGESEMNQTVKTLKTVFPNGILVIGGSKDVD